MEITCIATKLPPGHVMRRSRSQLIVDLSRRIIVVGSFLMIFSLPSSSLTSEVVPPVISEGPPMHVICLKKTSLPCTASGTSPLTYEWYRNGELLNPRLNSKVQKGADGSLILNQPEEGFYQCRVENLAGVAVSNITHLQAVVFEEAKRIPVQNITGEAYRSLIRPCNHILRSIPAASMSWKYSNDTPVASSNRVVVNDDGTLIFTSLLQTDSNRNNDYYKCCALNSETQREICGSYFNLNVTGADTGDQNGAPQLIYSSNDTVYVLEGQRFSLWCIFGGVNTAGALWQLPNKTTTPPAWRLHVANAKLSDEGNYTCSVVSGDSPRHTVEKVIKVIVDAIPRFDAPLKGQRVQRGSEVHFTCQSFGRPVPTVSWIINGTLYNSTQYNGTQLNGFQHGVSVNHTLVLYNVQSSASIACNVSNKHGYQLSSSYLIVGDTVVTTKSSQIWSSLSPSSPRITPKEMTSSTTQDKGSSTQTTPVTRSNSRSEEAVKTSTPFTPDNNGINQEEQKNNSGSASTDSTVSAILVPVIIIMIIVSGTIIVSIYCYRRRKKGRYSLNDRDDERQLKAEYIREQDTNTCDSDDSGYDDVGRKQSTSLKHIKRLSDTPEETYL